MGEMGIAPRCAYERPTDAAGRASVPVAVFLSLFLCSGRQVMMVCLGDELVCAEG